MATAAIPLRKDDGVDPRAALKRVIVDAQRSRTAADKQRDAIDRAQQIVQAARRKAEAASKAVAAARDQDVQQLAEAIASNETVSPRATVRAREAEIETADAVAMARSAYERLDADLADVEHDVERASAAVDAAAAEVLRPTVLRMIEEARGHHLRFLTMCAALNAVARLFNSYGDETAKSINRAGSISEADERVAVATRKEWESAVAALKLDADAPLPNDTPPT